MQTLPEEHIDEFAMRRSKLRELHLQEKHPFKYRYDRTHPIQEILTLYKNIEGDAVSEQPVKIAGRLIAKRGHGKAAFANIRDQNAVIQLYFKQDILGSEYDIFTTLDIGDILGIEGKVFRTHKGELSIRVEAFQLLTKSLNPLPEKFHGLHDKELRYRQRYVDLIANPEIRDVFIKRSQIIHEIRQFLHEHQFMEVETPVLQTLSGGASARPFLTYHNTLDMQLYLRIALELHLKRLIVGGFEKVYEIGRVFRNEGISFKHNPEYTLLELYQAYTDYTDMMALTEILISSIMKSVYGSMIVTYQDKTLDFTPPWTRITMEKAIQQFAGINIRQPFNNIKQQALNKNLPVTDITSKGALINTIYDKYVEHQLIQPTFITDYPLETSPLAKVHRDDPELVERFEAIVCGMEIANAFSELNDPIDQRSRFEDQMKQREAGDEEAQMMDDDFVTSLEYGMPPTGGLGIGIDRIVMLATNTASIRDVLLFPHMKNKP